MSDKKTKGGWAAFGKEMLFGLTVGSTIAAGAIVGVIYYNLANK